MIEWRTMRAQLGISRLHALLVATLAFGCGGTEHIRPDDLPEMEGDDSWFADTVVTSIADEAAAVVFAPDRASRNRVLQVAEAPRFVGPRPVASDVPSYALFRVHAGSADREGSGAAWFRIGFLIGPRGGPGLRVFQLEPSTSPPSARPSSEGMEIFDALHRLQATCREATDEGDLSDVDLFDRSGVGVNLASIPLPSAAACQALAQTGDLVQLAVDDVALLTREQLLLELGVEETPTGLFVASTIRGRTMISAAP